MSGIEAAFFGALGRDAEAKTSSGGKPYLRANVRVGDGDAAQWISVLAFDERALASADKYLKGTRVYCEGRLSLGEYMAGDGSKRASLSCMSWHFRLPSIGRNKQKRTRHIGGERAHDQAAPAPAGGDLNDEIPW